MSLRLGKTLAASAWMGAYGYRGELASIRHETAISIPGALSAEHCRQLIAKIDELADDAAHPRVWRDKVGSDTRILLFEQDIEAVLPSFEVRRWINAIDAYTGRKTRCWYLMANRVIPKADNLGSGGGWHRDSAFSHQIKCIWYLNDVSDRNGPFCYVPGTHRNLIAKRHVYPLGQTRFDSIQHEAVEMHATAGSLVACDTKCIHAGKPITHGARYAVTLYTSHRADMARVAFEKSGLDPSVVRQWDYDGLSSGRVTT